MIENRIKAVIYLQWVSQMAPLLKVILLFCQHLQHQQVVPKRWLEEWWRAWGVLQGWINPMRRAAWRKSLFYGQQVDPWMLASEGQWGLWGLHPVSLTPEQWNRLVEDDLVKTDITAGYSSWFAAGGEKSNAYTYLTALQRWGASELWALDDSWWPDKVTSGQFSTKLDV